MAKEGAYLARGREAPGAPEAQRAHVCVCNYGRESVSASEIEGRGAQFFKHNQSLDHLSATRITTRLRPDSSNDGQQRQDADGCTPHARGAGLRSD